MVHGTSPQSSAKRPTAQYTLLGIENDTHTTDAHHSGKHPYSTHPPKLPPQNLTTLFMKPPRAKLLSHKYESAMGKVKELVG